MLIKTETLKQTIIVAQFHFGKMLKFSSVAFWEQARKIHLELNDYVILYS